MTQNNSLTEIFGEVISRYTRAQAIEDGILADVSTMFPNDTRIYKFPVAFTTTLWDIIEGENAGAWVWDICYMSTKCIVARPNGSTVIFKCILPRKKGSMATKTYMLKATCSAGDNMEPVITICHRTED